MVLLVLSGYVAVYTTNKMSVSSLYSQCETMYAESTLTSLFTSTTCPNIPSLCYNNSLFHSLWAIVDIDMGT